VLWTHAGRVYLAAPDSRSIAPGKYLSLVYHGRELASARVEKVLYKELAVARLTSGSLVGVAHFDSIEVRTQAQPVPRLAMLRLGVPSARRSLPILGGAGMASDPANIPAPFRRDAAGDRSNRWVHDPAQASSGDAWPDTLVIRRFDDADDEEIAVERGELDMALFWPGELSLHMRQAARFQPPVPGALARGVIAGVRLDPDTAAARPAAFDAREWIDLVSFNRELFRGDLIPLERSGARGGEEPRAGEPRTGRPAHFQLDPAWPGRRVVERFLNRGAGVSKGDEPTATILLVYLDAPPSPPDSLARALAASLRDGPYPPHVRARADTLMALAAAAREGAGRRGSPADDPLERYLSERMRASFLFALGCPVVCQPELRLRLDALGADALVNLVLGREDGPKP
jgi:hypothetical protein